MLTTIMLVFSLMEILASVKQLRKCASEKVVWELQRGKEVLSLKAP